MLSGVQVNHELRQGAVHAGRWGRAAGQARAGELGGGFKVQPAMLLAQGDVILNRKSKLRGVPQRDTSTLPSSSAPTGTDSCGRLGMFSIQVVQLDLDAFHRLPSSKVAAHAIDFGEQRRDVFAGTAWPG